MYTLEEIKEILDAEDANTLEGYNLVRTNLMTKLSPALTEWDDLNKKYRELENENTRLKEANITLYNKVESQIMKKADTNDRSGNPDAEEEENTEPTADEKLADSVKSFAADI